MKSRQRRVRAIELTLTPHEVVVVWLRNALQAGTFEEGARHSPPYRGAIANEVFRTVRNVKPLRKMSLLPLLITQQILTNDGFGVQAKFRVLIAEFDGEPAGYAFFFDSYSTFQGRGLFLEDLFVHPEFRKNKIGRGLFSRVAAIAIQENCFGIMLHFLDWNEMAIQFYKR